MSEEYLFLYKPDQDYNFVGSLDDFKIFADGKWGEVYLSDFEVYDITKTNLKVDLPLVTTGDN